MLEQNSTVLGKLTVDSRASRLQAESFEPIKLSPDECIVAQYLESVSGHAVILGDIYHGVKAQGFTIDSLRKALRSLAPKLKRAGVPAVLQSPAEGWYSWNPVIKLAPTDAADDVSEDIEEPGDGEEEPDVPEETEEEMLARECNAIWPLDRLKQLMLLWDEGVPVKEIGQRIGGTKNVALGKIHRLIDKGFLKPRLVKPTLAPRRDVFEFTGPVCMWPHGHPGDEDFHFCGGKPVPGKPYCEAHVALAYIRPKDVRSKAA